MNHQKPIRKKHRWIVIFLVLAILICGISLYKTKSNSSDADLILSISEQGFEGHLYDAGEKGKVVITFSGSEGGSSASDTMAWYYKQHGISALGVTLFGGEETGQHLDRIGI